MLTFACVKWGTCYGAEYVNVLRDMVSRNLPAGTKGRFICFTDDPQGLYSAIEVRPLPSGLSGWWNKLALFAPDAFESDTRVVYFDLDTLILGALDEITKYTGKFGILSDPYYPQSYNSSVMIWTAGEQDHIWTEWNRAGRPEPRGGDQEWIQATAPGAEFLHKVFPQRFSSYKEHCYPFPPLETRVVYFHGEPKPHNCNAEWVRSVWKIGGEIRVDLKIETNMTEAALLDNIRQSACLDLPWVAQADEHDGHAVLVGSGPSLLDTIPEIAWRKAQGQTVFALNAAAKVLLSYGIAPDFQVILDGRPQNTEFVTACPLLLASQVAPELIESVPPEQIVALWHPVMADVEDVLPPRDVSFAMIGGGTTVGLSAMCLVYTLGYRNLHLYGYDSSHRFGVGHAMLQPMNDKEMVVTVHACAGKYQASPAMAAQAQKFPQLAQTLADLGCTITVHGTGLLPDIAKEMVRLSQVCVPRTDRANEILSRIAGTENPMGAEIGVYLGGLSGVLLSQNPDLTLYMVDAWRAASPTSDYAQSEDLIASVPQDRMEDIYQRAKAMVAFAKERAIVIRQSSVAAAGLVDDASLDFVFIDADHSYAGCTADIAAWYPKVKPDGLLCGHDYDNHHFPKFGVKRAVDDFAASQGMTLETGEDFTWFIRKSPLRMAA